MGKRKLEDNLKVKTEVVEVEVEEEAEKKVLKPKIKKEYHVASKGVNIKTSGTFKNVFISYDEALKLAGKDKGNKKNNGIIRKKFLRHVSLPYHMAGKTATQDAINYIAQNTVGRYKKEVNGIIMCVGGAEIVSRPRAIGDQFVFHFDVVVDQIIFKPQPNEKYEAVVKYVENGLIVGLVMNLITVQVEQTEKATNDCVDVDDTILIKYKRIEIKRSLCHLKGTYLSLVKKALVKVKEEVCEEEEEKEEEEEEKEDSE